MELDDSPFSQWALASAEGLTGRELLNKIDENQQAAITLTTAEDIQKRQKELEEENKAKRQLLTKAIADRKLKTTEENKMLTQCQNELQKMDLLVANDIGLLRKTIEEASIEFSEAQ